MQCLNQEKQIHICNFLENFCLRLYGRQGSMKLCLSSSLENDFTIGNSKATGNVSDNSSMKKNIKLLFLEKLQMFFDSLSFP